MHPYPLKKRFGQHFLRDKSVVDAMLSAVSVRRSSSVVEIGCGDGFLTQYILQRHPARLWGFEVDSDWAAYLREHFASPRLRIIEQDILTADLSDMYAHAPWIVLANLPYNITFPILYRLQAYRDLWRAGVLMMQEEVAQKIMQQSGRGYGFPSLFLQHYFMWKMLRRVQPEAFYPKPNVTSRLVYIQPIAQPEHIPYEQAFWQFVQACFVAPRKTLRNNLKSADYPYHIFSKQTLDLRAQQLTKDDFLDLWRSLSGHLS